MEVMFGKENIFELLESLADLIQKQNKTLSTEISVLETYPEIEELLKGWRNKSSEEIQSLYDTLKPIDPESKKPLYEEFIRSVAQEFEKNEDFKGKLCEIGEALVDLKETIKSKIQDEISIYKVGS